MLHVAEEDLDILYDSRLPSEDLPEQPKHELFGPDESAHGSEDEPDWKPMDGESFEAHASDTFNADFRDDMVSIVDVLQTLGVSATDATRYAMSVVKEARRDCSDPPRTFVEAYGTGNIMRVAGDKLRNLNLTGLAALDLRTCKPNGMPWDFRKRSDRRLAYTTVRDMRPQWVIGSPPCTAFSSWQHLNAKRMSPEARRAQLDEGRQHLRFMISIYRMQLREGRKFLHEHPNGASSWREPAMVSLLNHADVDTVTSDQCMYNLYTVGPQWGTGIGKEAH